MTAISRKHVDELETFLVREKRSDLAEWYSKDIDTILALIAFWKQRGRKP